MKKIVLVLMIVLSSIIFSKDNYIFNENRIRQVFSEYELVDHESKPQIWYKYIDRENDIRIQLSNYKKGDTKELVK